MTETFDALTDQAEELETRPDQRAIEETLLVALVTSPESTARIMGETRPQDFHFDAHRSLARLIYDLRREGRHVDKVTLRAALEGDSTQDPEAVNKLLALFDGFANKGQAAPPSLGKVESYLHIFTEAARFRLAQNLIALAGEELKKGEKSPTEAVGAVFKVVADLEVARRLSGTGRSEGDDLEAYFAALEDRQSPENDFQGLDSGFRHLNNVANGLTPGLFILGAAPSTGKTTFAKQLVDQVADLNKDVACLFVSLEQSKEELRVKTLSRLSNVENRDILRGRLDTKSQGWKKIVEAKSEFARYANRIFVLEGDSTTTPDRIRLAGIQVRQQTEADRLFIVIDYLQIVPTEKDFRDTRTKVDDVVSELRRIARDLGASILAVSAINRASYSQSGGVMESFKESGGIEFGADLAGIMIEAGKEDAGRRGNTTIEGVTREYKKILIDLVKNRNGEKARFGFRFFPSVSRFVEDSKEALPEG